MYSAVLMLALTAGSETADFGRNRCNGGGACSGAVVATCSAGASCSTAASCSSSGHGRVRLFGNRSHGCSSSSGCTTTAVVVAPACSASHSCSASNGCSSRHGLFSRLRDRGCSHNGHGCGSSYGCSSSTGCSGTIVAPPVKTMPKTGESVAPPKKTGVAVPATIVVSLPADARLIVDGTQTVSKSDRRTLVTPDLAVGETFVYTMQAEVVREGRTFAQTQQVTVRGGQTATVEFQFSNQGVASR